MPASLDLAGLSPVERIEMFIYDANEIMDNAPPKPPKPEYILRWHPGTTPFGSNNPIVWQGVSYEPMPIEADGFERAASGTLPRPRVRAANIGGLTGALLRAMRGGLGAKITRKRTLGKYLDGANFIGGTNPNADPTTYFPDEVYYITRKASENAIWIEVELAVKFDVAGIRLPRRQVMSSVCQWIYRSTECSYAGPPVQDINGNPLPPTPNPNPADQCRKTLDACKARFGANGVLRTSAFPGSSLSTAQ